MIDKIFPVFCGEYNAKKKVFEDRDLFERIERARIQDQLQVANRMAESCCLTDSDQWAEYWLAA